MYQNTNFQNEQDFWNYSKRDRIKEIRIKEPDRESNEVTYFKGDSHP